MEKHNKLDHLIASSLSSLNKLPETCTEDDFHHLLLEKVIEIIPAADAGFVIVFDDKMNKLLVEAAIGYNPVSYRKIQLVPGRAITGTAYDSKHCYVLNGQAKIRQAMEAMTGQNRQYYEESLPDDQFPYASLAIPLIFQGEVLAVLAVDGFTETAYFDEDTVELLNRITPYLALTYAHFLLVKREAAAQAELAITYKALRKEHTQLQRTTDLYNDLTALINQNRNVDDMMRAIYMSTQTPIAFYDELLFPIASFGTSPTHRLPDNFLSTKEVQYMLSVKKWQLISGEEASLLILPVIGAETVIGFLCAWIKEETFNDGNRLLLEYSASMLGLELMKKRAVEETQNKVAGNIFEQLISGNYNDDVLRQAKNLHLNETDYYTVLVCEGQRSADSYNQYFIKDSWIKWIRQTMKETGLAGLVTQRGMDVIAFLTVNGEEEKKIVRDRLKDFAQIMERIPYDVKIGIGRVYQGFIHVRKSYTDAQQCLEMLKKKKNGKVLRFSDSGIYRLLLDHDKDELDLFVHDHLGQLLELKTKKDKELLQTLLTYVVCSRDLTQVTKQLSIHHNTLYYRIKRIENILHVSFSDHEDWFDISLACKIYLFLNE